MPVNVHATAHVSQHISEISTHIRAAWDKHSDWRTIPDSEAAKYGLR